MIASWMLFALLVGGLITIAAFAADQAVAAQRRPTRFVWAAALALSLVWPLAPAIRRLLPNTKPMLALPFTIVVQAPSMSVTADASTLRGQRVDRALVTLWITGSLLLLGRLGFAVAALRRRRGEWKRGRVNGVRVQLSSNVGPAVVGLRSMDVVLPEWILSLDESLRAIVLTHEEEHRSARDPYLLFGAAIVSALMPWNPAVWIQIRRLRLAIEMDCDARVLRAHPSPERYGMLMLTIAQRRSASPALYAPMLTEPTTQLERRILAMRTTTRRLAQLSVYGGGAVSLGVLVFATSLQSAGMDFARPAAKLASRFSGQVLKLPATVTVAALPETRAPNAAATTGSPRPALAVAHPDTVPVVAPKGAPDLQEVSVNQGNAAPRYPNALRAAGVEGGVTVRFASDASGAVDVSTIEILQSTNDLFTAAVKSVLQGWHIAPNSAMQTPFVFVLADKSGRDLNSLAKSLPANAVVVNGVPAAVPEGPTAVSPNATFFEFQVEKHASPIPTNPAPRYPDALREANIEGEVVAHFIVNADGTPDMDSFKISKSTDTGFSDAVRAALPNMRFNPASVGGRPVRELITMPFQFDLAKGPPF